MKIAIPSTFLDELVLFSNSLWTTIVPAFLLSLSSDTLHWGDLLEGLLTLGWDHSGARLILGSGINAGLPASPLLSAPSVLEFLLQVPTQRLALHPPPGAADCGSIFLSFTMGVHLWNKWQHCWVKKEWELCVMETPAWGWREGKEKRAWWKGLEESPRATQLVLLDSGRQKLERGSEAYLCRWGSVYSTHVFNVQGLEVCSMFGCSRSARCWVGLGILKDLSVGVRAWRVEVGLRGGQQLQGPDGITGTGEGGVSLSLPPFLACSVLLHLSSFCVSCAGSDRSLCGGRIWGQYVPERGPRPGHLAQVGCFWNRCLQRRLPLVGHRSLWAAGYLDLAAGFTLFIKCALSYSLSEGIFARHIYPLVC